ncbi:hypothetical protein [Aquaspirillum serpens]|uniref:hypothetical protein n=1 Tax=Aquaspirillum serpens TaxID=190 RepID=UPI0003B49560|nr:hypothetical protein [Aquaspirillum serpens]
MKISSSSQRGDFSHLIHSPFKRMDGSTSPEKLLWKTEEYIKQHNDFDFAEKLKSVEKLLAGTHDQNRQVHFQQQLKQEADTVFRQGGKIVAILFKDGSTEWHGSLNFNIQKLADQSQKLSPNEYLMTMRQALIRALGSHTVHTSYGLNEKAPTLGELMTEQRSYRT